MFKKILFFLALLPPLGSTVMLAQTSVSGTVIAASDGQPVIGASVLVKGTTIGAVTDADGNYRITGIPSDAETLVVAFVGMVTQEVKIAPNLTIVLQDDALMLDEVVTVAYGTQKKSSITGAISQISEETIERRPTSSVTSTLEGTTSGVQVNNTMGQPGEEPSIRIRGFGTVNGSSSPLYVIDGVPFGGNISDINPVDIESISVLKDAASCALYGNRASNGVILITTKRGSSEKLSLEFHINQGMYSRGTKEYKRTNPYQFMEASWQNMRNARISAGDDAATAAQYASDNLISETLYLNIFNQPDTQLFDSDGHLVSGTSILSGYADDLDWYDQATRNGYRQEYVLNGNVSSQNYNMYFSLGYLDENGYTTNADFSRLSGRTSFTLTPVKWLKTGLNLSGTHQITNATNGNGDGASSYTNVFMYAREIAPIYPVHLHYSDGSYILDENGAKQYDPGYYTNDDGETISTRNQYVDRHVIWENELNMDKTYRNTLQGIAFMDISLPYGFTLSVKGDLNVRTSENQTYNSAIIGDGKGNEGRASRTNYRYKNYTFQQQLTWNKSYGSHYIDVLVAHENYSYNYCYQYGYKTTEVFEGKTSLSNFTNITSLTGYDNNYRTESYLARVRYNYADRYNLEASFRRDGSSRFAKSNRWGNFGSVGANWVISNEQFMSSVHWIDQLKLRANWGQVGNDAGADYYAYMGLYTASQNANLGAYYLTQYSSEDLKWETGESWGVAVESRMFNRWNFALEYFRRINKDLLFDVYLPLSAGSNNSSSASGTITQNLGTIVNAGIEINTDVDIFRNRDWNINFATNASFVRNKITKLPEQNREEGIVSGNYKIVEGKSRYEFYLPTFVGVDQMTGRSLYLPDLETNYIVVNEEIIGNEEGSDITDNVVQIGDDYYVYNTTYALKEFQGSALPKVYGGFTWSFQYKSLQLSALFTYGLGGKTYDGVYQSLMSVTSNPSNMHADIMKSWNGVPDGMTEDSANRIDPNGIPEINSTNSTYNNATSSRWLTKSDYLVFKNIHLSYSLPKKWARALTMQDILVTVSCENVFTLTARRGMNPQQSFSGSQSNYLVVPRVFSTGIVIKL